MNCAKAGPVAVRRRRTRRPLPRCWHQKLTRATGRAYNAAHSEWLTVASAQRHVALNGRRRRTVTGRSRTGPAGGSRVSS